MAKAPKKEKEKKEFNPLNNFAASKAKPSALASVQTKGSIASSIDQYVDMQKQIKRLENEQEKFKDEVVSEAKIVFAKRVFDGISGNLKLLGNEETLTFITQNSGSSLTSAEVAIIAEKFGKKAAADLTESDLSTLKFKPDFIASEANQKRIFAALNKVFNEEELAEMFQPISSKAKSTAIESAVNHVDSADDLANLYTALKLKAYIKV